MEVTALRGLEQGGTRADDNEEVRRGGPGSGNATSWCLQQ